MKKHMFGFLIENRGVGKVNIEVFPKKKKKKKPKKKKKTKKKNTIQKAEYKYLDVQI